MKLFECQACGQPLYFENDRCESCGRPVGFLSDSQALSALDAREAGRTFRALAAPDPAVRLCANAGYRACNWLVPADGPEAFCTACRHNRTIPDLSLPENLERWRRLETAKRRLFYTLLRLGLPPEARAAADEAARGPGGARLRLPLRPWPLGAAGHDGPRQRAHHHQHCRGRRRRARAAPHRHGRALPHAPRALSPRGRPPLLDRARGAQPRPRHDRALSRPVRGRRSTSIRMRTETWSF